MIKKKDRIITINIDKWKIHIPEHTHKELSTALIALACNFKDTIAQEAISDLRLTKNLMEKILKK